MPMTEFDLRALGWVVTRDLFWEVGRSLVGRTRRLPSTALEELQERWRAVQAAAAKTSGPFLSRVASSPLLRSMSTETRAAAAEYLILFEYGAPGTVFVAGHGRALPSCGDTSACRGWWFNRVWLPRGPLPPANRGCRACAVRDGCMAPDNVLAAALRAQAPRPPCGPRQLFRDARPVVLNPGSS